MSAGTGVSRCRCATRLGAFRHALVVAALLVPAVARADAAGDERYLRLEQVARYYAQMPALAQMQGPIIEVGDRRPLPALAAQGTKVAERVYAAEPAMAAMRSALGRVAGDVPPELGPIADRMAAVEHDLLDHPLAELQAREPQLNAQYKARSDRAAIDAVGKAMAAPELAGEVAVTGMRVKVIYEAVLTGDRNALRGMTARQIDASVRNLLDGARDRDAGQSGLPLRPGSVRGQRRLLLRAVLSQLPPTDVARLARFYASTAGRAKRAALLGSFRRANDEAGYRFMMALLQPLLAA